VRLAKNRKARRIPPMTSQWGALLKGNFFMSDSITTSRKPQAVNSRAPLNGYKPLEVFHLLPHHHALIEASSIAPEVAAARPYQSVTDPQRLAALGFAASQCITPALLLPVHNTAGDVVTYQARPDAPRLKDGKPLKYETPARSKLAIDVPPGARSGIGNPQAPLYITEGARKADSAVSRGLCCIALLGVWNWRGTNPQGGLTALPDWESIAFKGRDATGRAVARKVYIVFDSDVTEKDGVQKSLARLKPFLENKGARVKIIYLPAAPDGDKVGLDDYFAGGGTPEVLLSHASDELRAAPAKKSTPPPNPKGLPIIETNNRQLREKRDDAIAAIAKANDPARLFHGDSGLVVAGEDKDGAPVLRAVNADTIQNIMADAALWISTSERKGIAPVEPPYQLAKNYLVQSKWPGVPPIDGIVSAPIIAPDGTLCARGGYSAAARLWLALPPGFALPDTTPTAAKVEAAKVLIFDTLLGEVAFADNASRAHAVALMLLPFVRPLIIGNTPLHLIDAPTQSSGKTYAAEICIAPFAPPSASSTKGDDEEWRKAILAALLAGRSHIFFDNVKGRLSSPMLAAAITTPRLTERAMGGLGEVTATVRCVWVATSNNASLDADTASRCIVIRLDTGLESPEGRTFKSNPLAFITQNRAQVASALLTLVRKWQADGCPAYKGKHQTRFPQWQSIIGGILQAAGIDGFLDNVSAYRATLDPEKAAWCEFVKAWHKTHGEEYLTAAKLLPLALESSELAAMLGDRENQHAQRLGKQLKSRRDRIFAGLKLTEGPSSREGTFYKIASVASVAPRINQVRGTVIKNESENKRTLSSNGLNHHATDATDANHSQATAEFDAGAAYGRD
jgi:hypothetical protein